MFGNDPIFQVRGEKVSTMVLTDEAIRFSSRSYESMEEFDKAWGKQWTTATTFRIRYESIRRITKEDGDEKILIRYRSYFGLPSEVEFSFPYAVDYEDFFGYMEKKQYFTRIQERMRPVRAALPYILGCCSRRGLRSFFTGWRYVLKMERRRRLLMVKLFSSIVCSGCWERMGRW